MENEDSTINRFIAEIRILSSLSDDQIRQVLKRIYIEKPEIFVIIKQPAQRKILNDIKKMIKEVSNGKKN